MYEDFRAAAERIEANPLGRLMYGHRELFHSNLLAWFFDYLPDAADAVFAPLTSTGTDIARSVDREKENLDLVMHWPDRRPLVIENKVFSLPDKSQLDAYRAKVASWHVPPTLVLMAISAPHFSDPAWHYISYRELADRIDAALPRGSHYELETMRRYASLARDLHALVSAVDVASPDEPVWLEGPLVEVISSSQTRSALIKARAQRVARWINDAIPTLEQSANSGLTRATPLVESFEYIHTQGVHVHLGWQLQGSQFRRGAIYHDESIQGKDAASRSAREEVSRRHPEFFAMPGSLPQGRGGRKEFNHFAPNFVYTYVNAPGLTLRELVQAASEVHAGIERLREAEPAGAERPPNAIRKAP
ncbi:MAG: hypothetical protein CVT64_11135 [Actinobacteria bacterium HGW-Actinobacteria-4]|nr:MAG: hypothetical protein CVT64_11135 [Actinobacteria bacterium HGW-Actinobacteria-4]